MFGPIPLADQDGARFELAHRRELDRCACAGLGGHALQQPAGGGFQSAEHELLHPIGDGAPQQVATEAWWRSGFIELAPTRAQFVEAERLELRDLGAELVTVD